MSIKDDVLKLAKSGARRIVLDEIAPRASIPEVNGVATFDAGESVNRQLKSPLTEKSRTTYLKLVDVPENATQVEIECIQSLSMLDANGDTYVFNFADPAP